MNNAHVNFDLAKQPPATAMKPVEAQARLIPWSTAPAANSGSAFNLGDLWRTARRWWWQCTFAGSVLAVAACAAIWFFFEPVYVASSWMLIKSQQPHIVYATSGDSQMFAETQLQTIRSPVVLSRVLASEPEIAKAQDGERFDSHLAWLQKGLRANYVGRSELCEVSFQSSSPSMAAKVANAIVEAYLTLHRDKTGEQSTRIGELLSEEKRSREQEVEYLRGQVRDLARKITGHEPAFVGGDRDLVLHESPLSQFEQQRNQAEVEKAYLEAELTAYREAVEAGDSEVPAADIEKALAAHPGIRQLQTKVAALQSQLAEYKRVAHGKSADRVPQYVERVQEAENQLQRHAEELRPEVQKELQKARQEGALRTIAELEIGVRNQQALVDLWQSKVDAHRKEMEKTGDETLQLEFARADLLRSEEILDRISDRIMALRTERKAPERAEILQIAAAPPAPVEVLPYKKLAMAALGAFCIPFGLAFLWERWVRRISDAGQISTEANLPVLAEVSALPTRSSVAGRLSANRFARERATFEESIDALRVNLMLSPDSRDLRTLVVTSAVSREGKTSLAASLAASLSRSLQQPTLLIDADMRAPDLHEMFDAPLEPGLAGVLGGACDLDDALITGASQNVHFLPAGRLTVSPHLLLHSSRWPSLLSQLSSRYRYVIIDAPPVLAASESLILASTAEATLVCAMRDISRGPQLRSACDRLKNAGARILGTIISGVPTQTWAYKYGGYGYGRYQAPSMSADLQDAASVSKHGYETSVNDDPSL